MACAGAGAGVLPQRTGAEHARRLVAAAASRCARRTRTGNCVGAASVHAAASPLAASPAAAAAVGWAADQLARRTDRAAYRAAQLAA